MSERASYSRVYWTIVDDPKFASIFDDDHHLSAWLRMLLIADQSHPASAHMPTNVRRASVRVLADVGLVELIADHRYRIRGLDAERERRRIAATRDPVGTQLGPKRDPDGPYTPGLRRGGDEDKTRRDETSPSAAIDSKDCLDTYYELTLYRPWGVWSGDKLRGAQTDYGDSAVSDALRAESAIDTDRKTLLDRTLARLAREAENAKRARVAKPRAIRPVVDQEERARIIRQAKEAS